MITPSDKHYAYRHFNIINNYILYYESLKNEDNKYQLEQVEPGIARKYIGDFFGLLKYLKVSPTLFLPTLYLNGLTNPYDYDGRELYIKIAGEINFPKQ